MYVLAKNIASQISTGEKVSVREGDSAGFTFTPNKGYVISDVLANGKSVGADKTYTVTNVRSNQTIHVNFKASNGLVNPQTGVAIEDVQDNDWFVDSVKQQPRIVGHRNKPNYL